jgi:diacylglycerol kinase family enzyme
MWAIAINPQSGRGKGSVVGQEVVEYFAKRQIQYRTFSGATADELRRDLESFLNGNECRGVISVGGDGLAHLVLQLVVPRKIPFAPMPAGTGNDIIRTLGWSLDDITSYLDRVTQENAQPIDLGNVDSEWFAVSRKMYNVEHSFQYPNDVYHKERPCIFHVDKWDFEKSINESMDDSIMHPFAHFFESVVNVLEK